jgi:hypothetical protein
MDRRQFLKKAGTASALTILVAGSMMTPAEAFASARPTTVLKAPEAATLAAFGDALVPGARAAGVAHFIDYQLSLDPNDCLLMAKYFNIVPPYSDFYRAGLKALNQYTQKTHGKSFEALDAGAARQTVQAISAANPEGWEGPPAPLFYLLVRSDAVDVVYGTEEGFEKLGIPYMAHIKPPKSFS